MALEAAHRSLGVAATPTSHGADVPAAPPTQAGAVIAQRLAALNSTDPEVLRQLHNQMEGAGVSVSEGTSITSVLAFLVKVVSSIQQEIAENEPLGASAAPQLTAPSKVQAAQPVSTMGMSGAGGDSRLTARDQVKEGKRLPLR